MKNKKVVIIIEDEKKPFSAIQKVFSDDYPNDKQKYTDDTFEDFRTILRNALSIDNTDPDEPGKSKELLLKKLKSYYDRNEEPVYLIDFLLDGDTYHPTINGIHFHKLIHKELYKNKKVPSLFITATEGTNLIMVQDYCEGIGDKTLCHFKPKPSKWDEIQFKKGIIEFIENAQSKPQTKHNDKHIEIEDIYDPN
jgi:hypothetical protein